MSVARTWAVALTGLRGDPVEVEADVSSQTPEFAIIGLPDKSLGEAGRRVRNACANRGLDLPKRRITVNLSPASLPKRGSGFDVANVCLCHVSEDSQRGSLRSPVAKGPRGHLARP